MQNWLKFCILFSIGVLSCLPTLWGDFLFDDGEAVSKNGVVTHRFNWTRAFYTDFWGVNISHPKSHKSYRPLTTLTYRLDYAIWGLNPFPFHFENLVIHGLNCGIVYFFLIKCLQTGNGKLFDSDKVEKLAFWASLLFSVHPIHVEPLGGVVGRADLLSGFVFMLGFLFIPDTKDGGSWKTCVLLMAFSIIGSLFKENAITLCILYVALQFAVKNGFRTITSCRRTLMYHALCIFGTGMFVICRVFIHGPPVFQVFDNPPAFATPYFTKISSILYVWAMNGFILLNPIWLCYDWSGGCIKLIDSYKDFRFVLVVFFVFFCIGILLKSIRNRIILVSSVLFLVSFLPSSNLFFKVGFVLAERNLYLPSIGFSLFIAYTIMEKGNIKIFVYILLILMARSINRSFQWKNQFVLFTSGATVCSENAKIHYNLGSMFAEKGDTFNAEHSYKYAIKLRSDYYQAMNNLGNLLRSKDKNESEYWLKRAVQLKPDFAAAWMNLGIVMAKKNQSEALICYENALKNRQSYPDCEYNLGNLHLDMGNTNAALKCWTKATQLKPDHVQSWINRIILLEQQEKLEDAKNISLEAVKAVPHSDTIHFLLGNLFGKLSKFSKAEFHFFKAIDISKSSGVPVKYFSNLGVLYHRWGRKDLAIEAYHNALKIDSNSESVKKNLMLLNK